ncbi:SDR family oxidoreductase [Lichenihabitans sp. Uapishka_5]|uniref:SDR family oxidoreductase n=1 Tax=Lichenihabitans sp. Uapishka_5 TaxID=3037302 RepID=UPI0029E827FC|nr:SDR family oxidoreductase [Lichenihabitans sp. Uapishka_5]MDX7953913.1 SDR family oxidoreductase [Lichenihabitans sp. Uapishka_5]
MRLHDQRVVVIGGTSGMGMALAEKALVEGASSVVVVGRTKEGAEKAASRLGDKVAAMSLDIGNEAEVAAFFNKVGNLDHLVTTAAQLTYGPLAELKTEAIEQMLASKFWGPFFAARYAAPRLSASGSITFFSGLAAYRPGPGTSVVASLNAALEGFAKALAVELAPVRVNCISPGVVETAGWNFMPEKDRLALFDHLRMTLPARRIGEPADLADAAVSVMTNPYITGTVLAVDGGGSLA